MYEVIIRELQSHTDAGIFRKESRDVWQEVYRQRVTELDVRTVVAATNERPEKTNA